MAWLGTCNWEKMASNPATLIHACGAIGKFREIYQIGQTIISAKQGVNTFLAKFLRYSGEVLKFLKVPPRKDIAFFWPNLHGTRERHSSLCKS